MGGGLCRRLGLHRFSIESVFAIFIWLQIAFDEGVPQAGDRTADQSLRTAGLFAINIAESASLEWDKITQAAQGRSSCLNRILVLFPRDNHPPAHGCRDGAPFNFRPQVSTH